MSALRVATITTATIVLALHLASPLAVVLLVLLLLLLEVALAPAAIRGRSLPVFASSSPAFSKQVPATPNSARARSFC
jgi:hypothetical protein